MRTRFNYEEAFSRNLGWITKEEQEILRNSRVAIGGLGGVGGSHALTLARLGIANFTISDFDKFELPNFNRQAGANTSNLNKYKTDVLFNMILDINPTANITILSKGVSKDNILEFLDGVDIYIDGIDFFAFEARELIFDCCHECDIPAISAAPLGMGTAFMCFMPGQISFEEYFQMKGKSDLEKALHFLVGFAPSFLHVAYLVDESYVDLANHKGPSTAMGCELCAGVIATQALKILLNRGEVITAPYGLHFDAYRNKLVKTWRPFGNKNPLQQLLLAFARRKHNKFI